MDGVQTGLVGEINKAAFEDAQQGGAYFKPKAGIAYELDFFSVEQTTVEIVDSATQTKKVVPGLKCRVKVVAPKDEAVESIEFTPLSKRLCKEILAYAERQTLFKWRFGLKLTKGSNGFNEYSLQALGERT